MAVDIFDRAAALDDARLTADMDLVVMAAVVLALDMWQSQPSPSNMPAVAAYLFAANETEKIEACEEVLWIIQTARRDLRIKRLLY